MARIEEIQCDVAPDMLIRGHDFFGLSCCTEGSVAATFRFLPKIELMLLIVLDRLCLWAL